MKNPDISVVVLNFNTKDMTRECVLRLFDSDLKDLYMEVIVVDNGSSDGSIQMIKKEFPKAICIDNKKNLGFAAGNNPGIRRARGRYVLLLNSDCEVAPNALFYMVAFMDEYQTAGASTCKLILQNGLMDPACHRGFPTPWVSLTYLTKLEKLFPKTRLFGEYHQGYKDLSVIHEVDCISGAFFLVRREVIDQVGLLDEDYFMYGEDIDWAFRIRKAGWKILFNPNVSVLHKKKQSGRLHVSRKLCIRTELYFHTYNWLFYKKNYAARYGRICTYAIHVAYTIRMYLLKKFGI